MLGKKPDEVWDYEAKLNFSSRYTRFSVAFEANGGNKLSITTGDAFLAFIKLYDYHMIDEKNGDGAEDTRRQYMGGVQASARGHRGRAEDGSG